LKKVLTYDERYDILSKLSPLMRNTKNIDN
jgi:hypothetical protein